jgi:hypothetical protein
MPTLDGVECESGKHVYSSWHDANRVKEKALRRNTVDVPEAFRPYRCPKCPGWHLGHSFDDVKASQRKRA